MWAYSRIIECIGINILFITTANLSLIVIVAWRSTTADYNSNSKSSVYSLVDLRLHIEHVFDSHFPLPVPLMDQFVFGPGHVHTVRCGSFVIHRRMWGRVSVVDQLGLNKGQMTRYSLILLVKHWIPMEFLADS